MPPQALNRAAFAGRLNQAMTKAGVDRLALAAAVDAHPNRVREWTHGKRWPALAHLVAVGSALGVDVDWLLTGRTSAAGGQPPAASATTLEAVAVARDLAQLAPRLVPLAKRAQRATGRT